jgi:leader peptidase (prepilin peptidase) / N-methyltransferase
MLLPLAIVVFFLFVFGLVIGSFLHVVIDRSLRDESPLEGRSYCPECKKQIAWYDNIPLVSYMLLGGKCRNCKKPIALSYPLVEFLTGALFVWWYLGGFLIFQFFQLNSHPFVLIQPIFWLVVGILLLIIFFTDAIAYIIPDYAVACLTVLVTIYRLALWYFGIMTTRDIISSFLGSIGLVIFFFALWAFTKGRGMGFGDVKFSFPMGLLLGWPNMLAGVMVAFIIGAVTGVMLIGMKRKSMKAIIPFGPFLVIGTLLSLVFGDQLVQWYLGVLVH